MANFGGKGSCKIFEKHMMCPQCSQSGAYYTGCEVTGNHGETPAADTEVEYFYICANPKCQFEWSALV